MSTREQVISRECNVILPSPSFGLHLMSRNAELVQCSSCGL